MGDSVDFCALVGKNIRAIRNARGMTQGDLAEKLDVSVVTVSQVENGKVWPKAAFFSRVVAVFGIRPFELFIRSEDDMESMKQIIVSSLIEKMDMMYPTPHGTAVNFSTTHKRKP